MVSYDCEYSNPCVMDWNREVNLACVLLWFLFSKETEPMCDDRWTLFSWFTEKKSAQKETRETCPCGDQRCLIRKTGGRIFF